MNATNRLVPISQRYASVEHFEIDLEPSGYATIIGYAAPKSGRMPCGVKLIAGDETLAISKAAQYSTSAAKKAIRYGWCGFKIGGASIAAAIGDTIELRCVMSERVLQRWEPLQILQNPSDFHQRPYLSVGDFRSLVKQIYGCGDPSQIEVFADHFRRFRGDRAFVEAVYRWLLRRTPSATEVDDLIGFLPVKWGLHECTNRIIASEEFQNGPGYPADGPFEANFPFGLDLF